MYASNYLVRQLRQASIDHDDAIFARLPCGAQVSYGDLFGRAEQVAAALMACGIKPGDRVAAQVGKSITSVTLYIGCVLAGGVFLPLNTDYTPAEVSYFLTDASPKVFVCDLDREFDLSVVAKNAQVDCLLSLSEDGERGSLVSLVDSQRYGFQGEERKGDDLAAILYTSGTTGRSKGAMLSHRALAANAQTLVEYWQFTREDRLIHALPIFHIHGLFVAIHVTLFAGSSLYFMPKFNAGVVMEHMANATVLMGVPTFYVRLLKEPQLNRETVNHMRLFVSGSAPLLEETHAKWLEITGHAI